MDSQGCDCEKASTVMPASRPKIPETMTSKLRRPILRRRFLRISAGDE
jgi:hypothetical protein